MQLVDAIPTKTLNGYFAKINKLIHRFMSKFERPRIAKTILIKKNKVGGIMHSDFKLYYRLYYNNQNNMVQNNMAQKSRHIDQRKSMQSAEINLCSCG